MKTDLKKSIAISALGLSLLGLTAAGCGTITGAAIGGATGAGIGAATHHRVERSAIIGAGLLLALQRLIAIVLALFSGPLTDRLGAHRLLLPCTLAVAIGFRLSERGRGIN